MIEQRTMLAPYIPHPLMVETRDDLVLLLHPNRPVWAAVNRLGLQIAELCDGTRSMDQIAGEIARRYGQDPQVVRADVEAYLEQLSHAGLLRDDLAVDARSPLADPVRLYLCLTERCNLRCRHCAVGDGLTPADALSTEEVQRLIDQLSPERGDTLLLSGGEPLLRHDALDLLRYASSRVPTHLVTNATLIDERIAAALGELDLTVQISLDGASPATHDRIRGKGAFYKAMRAVDLLREHGFTGQVVFSMTVLKPNIADVPNVVDLAERMGVDLRLVPVQKLGRAEGEWAELHPSPEEYERLYTYIYRERARTAITVDGGFQGLIFDVPGEGAWCGMGSTPAVDPMGNVYPCSLLMIPELCLGNVKHASLQHILSSCELRRLKALCDTRKARIEGCSQCHWRNFCQSGCPAVALLEKGTLLDTDDLCALRQRFYRELLFDLVQKKASSVHVPAGCL